MLHYCVDDENDQTASACGHLFSDQDALKYLTREVDKVFCSNCMHWMKKRGILPGDRGKFIKVVVLLNEEDSDVLKVMAKEADFTRAELLRHFIRRAAIDRRSLMDSDSEET